MQRTWTFTDLEFLVLWEELGEEFLPIPLMYASRTEWWDDHLTNLARAKEALRDRDPVLAEVLPVLRTPDVRVEVRGWDGRDRTTAEASIRMLGIRSGDFGYLVVQQPGETVRHSAGFTVTEFDARELAAQIVTALPDTAAGRGSEIVLAESEHTEDFDYGYGLSPAHESMEGTVINRASDFLAAPAPSMGTIDVVQGRSRFGPRGIIRFQLEWRDLADDGRYVVTADFPPVAVPADRKRMATAVDARITEVLMAIEDE